MTSEPSNMQFGYEDHFTPARSKKKRKNRPQTAPPSPAALLHRASGELAHSDWLRDSLQSLRKSLEEAFAPSDDAPGVLCLGLGSPAASRDARAQLALLLAACDDLSIDHTKVSVYDPVFAAEDVQLLAHLGLTALPENRHASYEIRSPTIVFMPHCDLHLYENILRANWTIARLPNVLLIANPLSEYAESIPSRKLISEHPCVARLAPYLTSRPLRACAPFPTAFNHTSIQFVPAAGLAARDADWWALPGTGTRAPETAASATAPDERTPPASGELEPGAPASVAPVSVPVRPDGRTNADAGGVEDGDKNADTATRTDGDMHGDAHAHASAASSLPMGAPPGPTSKNGESAADERPRLPLSPPPAVRQA
ncbi:SRR1-domain-containing protein [Trametes meyenii]|nr:SRR1-domain-containing protein [Trametes meyenii]